MEVCLRLTRISVGDLRTFRNLPLFRQPTVKPKEKRLLVALCCKTLKVQPHPHNNARSASSRHGQNPEIFLKRRMVPEDPYQYNITQ